MPVSLCGGERAVQDGASVRSGTKTAVGREEEEAMRRGGREEKVLALLGFVRSSPRALCTAARHAGTSDPRGVFFYSIALSLSSVVTVDAATSR